MADPRFITADEVADNYVPIGESATWGTISGLLSDQGDLQSALDAKQQQNSTLTDLSGKSFSGEESIALAGNTLLWDFPDGNPSLDGGARKLYGPDGSTVLVDWSSASGIVAVFPSSDPHVVGAGYWVANVLTKSAG